MAQRDLDDTGGSTGVVPTRDRVVVRSGAETLAITATDVLEIMEPGVLVRLPGAPREAPGIVSRRGSPATVVDLGRLLGREPCRDDPAHRLVVVRWRGFDIALAVDSVVALGDSDSEGSSPFLDLEAFFERVF